MEVVKIIAIVVGTAGFWKLLETAINNFSLSRLKNAEAKSFQVQSEKTVIANWIQWSEMLEKKVKEAYEHTTILEEIISTLEAQIKKLEAKVAEMEKNNDRLRQELSRLKGKNDGG